MDLRESMRDSAKVFREGLHVQLATKLFYLETFMVYSMYVPHLHSFYVTKEYHGYRCLLF